MMPNSPASSERPDTQPQPQDEIPYRADMIELEISLLRAEVALALIELGVPDSAMTEPNRMNVPMALVGTARAS